MNWEEATAQVSGMVQFIKNEAKGKAAEVSKKGEEEFNIEVHRLVTEQKEKIRQNYEKKAKQVETHHAIQKSMAINKQRLEKIQARQKMMHQIELDVKPHMVRKSQEPEFITKLIVQGLLMLLEESVSIRCRESDARLVRGCFQNAMSEYTRLIKEQTGATKKCTLTMDSQSLAPEPVYGKEDSGPSCLGGVVLVCCNGRISIDNTIDMRLKLVMEQAKPAIRGLLFPTGH